MNLLKAYAFLCGILFVANTFFYALYMEAAPPFIAWFIALRYNLATVTAALALPGLSYLLFFRSRRVRKFSLWLAGAVVYYTISVLIADITYYGHAGKHATVELQLYYKDFIDINKMALKEYPLIAVGYVVLGILFFYAWRRLVKKEDSKPVSSLRYKTQAAFLVGFLLLTAIFFRGGLQGRPLRPANAFEHLSQTQGDFALNGAYTAFYALFHRASFPVASNEEALKNAQKKIQTPDETFLNADYPFYRALKKPNPNKKNVVVLILESWSAARVGFYGDKVKATPFFDTLARKSWVFNRAFATGRRSIASLPSIVSGIPTLYGSLFITSPFEQNTQSGMGAVFHGAGYATYFTYAAKAGSMGFNAYAKIAGFENILTREDFLPETETDGVWGIFDHLTFKRVLNDLEGARKPFASVVYTLHPHPPFTLPQGFVIPTELKERIALHGQKRAPYYNALFYSDKSLEGFFEVAKTKSWFQNTVFVLVADHAYEESMGLEAFHIPLLFYAPGFVSPRTDERIVSQLDILPTLVSLLQLQSNYASMGQSLISRDRHPEERFAFIDLEHAAGFVGQRNGKDAVLVFDTQKYLGYYDAARDAAWRTLKNDNLFASDEKTKLKDFIGAMGYAVAKNRIAPRMK